MFHKEGMFNFHKGILALAISALVAACAPQQGQMAAAEPTSALTGAPPSLEATPVPSPALDIRVMPATTAGLPEEFPPVGAGLSEEIAAIWAKSVEGIPEAERSGSFLTFEDQPHLFLYTSRPIEATNPQSLEAELREGLNDVWALNAEGRLWKITEEGEKVGRGPAGRLFVYDETHLKEVLDGEGNLLGLATGAGDEGWEKGVLGQLSTQSQKSLEGDLAQILAQVEKKRLAGDVHLVLTADQTHLYFQDAEGKRFVLDAEGNLQPLPEEAELDSEGVFRWGGNHWDWVIRQVVEPTPTPVPDDAPNSIAEVTETSPNGAKIERYINPSGDEDWFRFELTAVSNINVQLTSLPADYDLYLYDADGLLLEASERRGVMEERIIRKDQPTGYYYVRVVGYDGAWDADNSYLLRFKVN